MDVDTSFCGQMSSIYVFSEALSPAQVVAIYQLGPGYKVSDTDTTVSRKLSDNVFEIAIFSASYQRNSMLDENITVFLFSLFFF